MIEGWDLSCPVCLYACKQMLTQYLWLFQFHVNKGGGSLAVQEAEVQAGMGNSGSCHRRHLPTATIMFWPLLNDGSCAALDCVLEMDTKWSNAWPGKLTAWPQDRLLLGDCNVTAICNCRNLLWREFYFADISQYWLCVTVLNRHVHLCQAKVDMTCDGR